MADFVTRVGDRLPQIAATLQDASGTAVNLTGATVKWRMRLVGEDTYTVDAAAVVDSAAGGTVHYVWAAVDVDTAGHYFGHWFVTFADSRTESFPNDEELVIDITSIDAFVFSYSGDPSSSTSDQVRFLLGDTSADTPYLGDAEIAWVLSIDANPFFAAALGADIISARYAGSTSKSVGDLSISGGEKARGFRELATSLRAMGNDSRVNGVPVPYMGGATYEDKRVDRDNTDLVQPYFRVGIMGGGRHSERELSTDVAIDQHWRGYD